MFGPFGATLRLGSGRHTRARRPIEGAGAYVGGAAVVVTCTVLSVIGPAASQAAVFIMVFPLGVLAMTARFGAGPAAFTAVGGALAFDFVFVPPALAFALPGTKDGITLAVMLLVAGLASLLADRLRRKTQAAERQTEVERLRNALLSALSHDLRSPLTGLVGVSSALCEERLDPAERKDFCRIVAEEASRLNRLVDNLLELTRLESGQLRVRPDPQAIDEVIGAALSRLEKPLSGRLVRTDVPEAIPLALFDPVLIEQVLINLLENVIRHTPDGSPIDISVGEGPDGILMKVSDRGPGVAKGDEEKIFGRLYRGGSGARSDGGVGLGLTICRAILTAHGGRIGLQNRPGGGATVTLTLPAETAAKAAVRSAVLAPRQLRAP